MQKVLPFIRMCVPLFAPACRVPSDPPRGASVPPLIFRLMIGPTPDDVFYECQHCSGSGGSVFSRKSEYIPDEVGEEMYVHSRLCESLPPKKA